VKSGASPISFTMRGPTYDPSDKESLRALTIAARYACLASLDVTPECDLPAQH